MVGVGVGISVGAGVGSFVDCVGDSVGLGMGKYDGAVDGNSRWEVDGMGIVTRYILNSKQDGFNLNKLQNTYQNM